LSLNNLAGLYHAQGRYGEAEPLHKRALEAEERVLGKDHSQTLLSLNNLAGLYYAQGRYDEAEPLFKRTIEAEERVLGKDHPQTLASLGNRALLLTAEGKTEEALRAFRSLDSRLAFWLDAEITSTEGADVRRLILEANSGNQSAMLSFALKYPSEASARFAADLALRWKKRLLQDEAYLANLMRTSKDPNIIAAANTVRERGRALAAAALAPKAAPEAVEALKQSFEAAEADLRRRSQDYRRYLQAKRATAQDVEDALPRDGVLIEYRFFNPFDFEKRLSGKLHLLAALLRPNWPPALFDLGEAGPIIDAQQLVIDAKLRKDKNIPLPELWRLAYNKLIAPLKDHLAGAKTLFVSPDGPLSALTFDALLTEKNEPLLEIYTVRLMQTGRDLVARDRIATGNGLVAFGGIDFGQGDKEAQPPAAAGLAQIAEGKVVLDVTRGQIGWFKPLEHSGEEVDAIAETYGDRRSGEPKPIVYKGLDATKAKLKALVVPPRVLHLATHGFYLRTGSIAGQPLLQSGVSFAGANDGLAGKVGPDGDNGILHAIEASGLNLVGTELVVLSACQTGQGVLNYSEGLEGLPSAFYTAGAKNVLVALWNVDDEGTKEFMKTFYDRWTLQPISDPAAALKETKTYFLSHPNQNWRNPQIWAAFVLFEG
jgi:CHAT domain-containing protein